MTLGGLAIVLAFMAAVVLLALVVVLAAAWSSLEGRRGGADRRGRLIAAGMTRVEHLLARGRRALQEGAERLAPLLAAGLGAAAHRVQSLADRLGARPRPEDGDGDLEASAASPTDGAAADAPAVRRPAQEPAAAGRARDAERSRADAVPPGVDVSREPVRDADRLPTSFRDRIAG